MGNALSILFIIGVCLYFIDNGKAQEMQKMQFCCYAGVLFYLGVLNINLWPLITNIYSKRKIAGKLNACRLFYLIKQEHILCIQHTYKCCICDLPSFIIHIVSAWSAKFKSTCYVCISQHGYRSTRSSCHMYTEYIKYYEFHHYYFIYHIKSMPLLIAW